jgi:hypothetical protein
VALLESTEARSRKTYLSGTEVVASRLDTYVLEVLPKDLLTVLRGVALQELDEQVTAGNLPSQILVDGRSVAKRSIPEAVRSVSLRFADVSMLIDAINDAYRLLVRATRLQAPPKNAIVARQNFWLYVDGVPAGKMPGALARLKVENLTYKSVLRVVGPLVNYGRKLYWNPIGRSAVMQFRQSTSLSGRSIFHYDNSMDPRFKPARMRTLRKLANAKGGNPAENLKNLLAGKPGYTEGTGQIVKRVMRRDRRYKALHISDGWVSYPPAASWGKSSKDDRVPSISVQMARKGGIRIVSVL